MPPHTVLVLYYHTVSLMDQINRLPMRHALLPLLNVNIPHLTRKHSLSYLKLSGSISICSAVPSKYYLITVMDITIYSYIV